MREQVRQACKQIGGGRMNVRVRLADLRAALADMSRNDLDATIAEMEQDGAVDCWSLDDPRQLTQRDHDAAIRTRFGAERHIVYCS